MQNGRLRQRQTSDTNLHFATDQGNLFEYSFLSVTDIKQRLKRGITKGEVRTGNIPVFITLK